MTTGEKQAYKRGYNNGFILGYALGGGVFKKKKDDLITDRLILTVNIEDVSRSYTPFNYAPMSAERVEVDWGDGNVTIIQEDGSSHQYSEPGVYDISIKFEGLTSLNLMFAYKTEIISIDGAFTGVESATYSSYCFYGCTSLTTLGDGIFANCTSVTDFSDCFRDCTSLTTLGDGIFANCTSVTDFSDCFGGCTSLTNIPDNLFSDCTSATDFWGCFNGCTSLTNIPDNLFSDCTSATKFNYCFNGCTSLTNIPDELFDNCLIITNLYRCFYNCTRLEGEAPDLWNRNNMANDIDARGCFGRCVGLSNYDAIPGGWK